MFKTQKKGETTQRRCSLFSFFEREEPLHLNFSASSEHDGEKGFFQSISGTSTPPKNTFIPKDKTLKNSKPAEFKTPQMQPTKNLHLCENFNYD
jgi:hypothetical protein